MAVIPQLQVPPVGIASKPPRGTAQQIARQQYEMDKNASIRKLQRIVMEEEKRRWRQEVGNDFNRIYGRLKNGGEF